MEKGFAQLCSLLPGIFVRGFSDLSEHILADKKGKKGVRALYIETSRQVRLGFSIKGLKRLKRSCKLFRGWQRGGEFSQRTLPFCSRIGWS
jgi:hypothetical protein